MQQSVMRSCRTGSELCRAHPAADWQFCKALSCRIRPRRTLRIVQVNNALGFNPDTESQSNGSKPVRPPSTQTNATPHRSSYQPHNGRQGLPVSLYAPFNKLPPEGKTQLEAEETCNPEERSCQTPIYVYEEACGPCQGTGTILTRSRNKRSSYTCPSCHGLGYVRCASSRILPDMSNGHYTMARPEPDLEEPPKPKPTGSFRRKRTGPST